MTVRVNKDAFNIREKLSELDYDQVPYEKMPSGSIIQVATNNSSSNISINSSAYSDFSGASIIFSPKLSNSKLLITFNGALRQFVLGNARGRIPFGLQRNGSQIVYFGEEMQVRNLNFHSSSVEFTSKFYFETIDSPETTEPTTYTWHYRSIDSATVDTGGQTYRQTIYEIKQ